MFRPKASPGAKRRGTRVAEVLSTQYADIFSQQLNKITKKFTLEIITVLKLVKVTFSETPKLLRFQLSYKY